VEGRDSTTKTKKVEGGRWREEILDASVPSKTSHKEPRVGE